MLIMIMMMMMMMKMIENPVTICNSSIAKCMTTINKIYIFFYICIVAATLPGSLRIAVTFRSKEKLPRLSIEDTTWRTTLILGLAVSN